MPVPTAPDRPLSKDNHPITKPIAAPVSVTAATTASIRPIMTGAYRAASSGAAGHQAWKWWTGECPAPTR